MREFAYNASLRRQVRVVAWACGGDARTVIMDNGTVSHVNSAALMESYADEIADAHTGHGLDLAPDDYLPCGVCVITCICPSGVIRYFLENIFVGSFRLTISGESEAGDWEEITTTDRTGILSILTQGEHWSGREASDFLHEARTKGNATVRMS